MTHYIVPRRLVVRPASFPFRAWNFDAFDQLFADRSPTVAARAAFEPRVNVSESDQQMHFSVELPGLELADFEVLVDDDVLVIKGEKATPSSTEDRFHRVERSSGAFERKFRVGWEIDADNLKATFKNGVLDVDVAKPVDVQDPVRTIPVTTS